MKTLVLFLLLIIIVLLPGCWDMKEMEELGFVNIIGLDRQPGKDQLILTVGINNIKGTTGQGDSNGGSSSKSQGTIYQASAQTLFAALGRLQQISRKNLFLSDVRIIVIGEEAARKNMKGIISFLDRDRELRRSSSVLITPGKAADVLSTIDPGRTSASEILLSIINDTKQTGVAFDTRLGDNIFEPLAISGIEPIAARVLTTSPPAKLGEGQANGIVITGNVPDDQGTQGTVAQNKGQLRVSGMAVFRGLKLVGWLNEKESMGWGFVKGQINRGYLVNLTSRTGKLPVTFHLLAEKSSIRFNLKDSKTTANVTIKVQAELSQLEANEDLLNPGNIKGLEADLAEAVKNDAMASLKKAQRELKSDVFGFGFQLNKQDYREWNHHYMDRWPEIFPTLPINVKVIASIQETGTVFKEIKIIP